MPHIIENSTDKTRTIIQLSGYVTGEEIISINEKLIKNTDCISQIWDFLNSDKIELSNDEIHKIAIQDSRLSLCSRIQKVAIAVTDELARGLDDLYEHSSKNWVGRPHGFESQSFPTMNEAVEWIYSDDS